MAFELGFLVGSLALLGLLIYVTRFRGPSLPHETAEGEREIPEGDTVVDGVHAPSAEATVEQCDLCGENPATRSVSDMRVCGECDEDLLT
ncbi:hypothetical protein [Haloplanus pelagicus]|jgi:hypothetical protein|uniref:hypothetical protein n=1 Tax=Haloplanus pelagicus TaxID=2949995 RepID=UPI0020415765|nr:hypothetical protein [Haloplanus sp. HW8-1]